MRSQAALLARRVLDDFRLSGWVESFRVAIHKPEEIHFVMAWGRRHSTQVGNSAAGEDRRVENQRGQFGIDDSARVFPRDPARESIAVCGGVLIYDIGATEDVVVSLVFRRCDDFWDPIPVWKSVIPIALIEIDSQDGLFDIGNAAQVRVRAQRDKFALDEKHEWRQDADGY